MIPFRADILEAIRRTRRQTKIIVGSSLAGFIAAVTIGTFAMWMYLFGGMPSIPDEEALWRINREPAIEFVDRSGTTIGVRGPRYGRPVQAGPDVRAGLEIARQQARPGDRVVVFGSFLTVGPALQWLGLEAD